MDIFNNKLKKGFVYFRDRTGYVRAMFIFKEESLNGRVRYAAVVLSNSDTHDKVYAKNKLCQRFKSNAAGVVFREYKGSSYNFLTTNEVVRLFKRSGVFKIGTEASMDSFMKLVKLLKSEIRVYS